MDRQQAAMKLFTWTDEELLYRDYYTTKKEGLNEAEFRKKWARLPGALALVTGDIEDKYLLTEKEYIPEGLNVYISKSPRYYPFFWHEHEFFEIVYILNGNCRVGFPDRTLRLSRGDVCFLTPARTHGISVKDDECVALNVLVRYSTIMDIFMNAIRDKSLISAFFLNYVLGKRHETYLLFHTGEDTLLRDFLLDIYCEQQDIDPFSDRIICSLLTIFLAQLTRRHADDAESSAEKSDGLSGEIISYIFDNYRDVSLEDIAGHFHFTPQYCSKLIKASTGASFMELLTGIRLRQSKSLMLSTSLSLASISEQVGYKNPETFIRVFKKSEGMTPTEFRAREKPRTVHNARS